MDNGDPVRRKNDFLGAVEPMRQAAMVKRVGGGLRQAQTPARPIYSALRGFFPDIRASGASTDRGFGVLRLDRPKATTGCGLWRKQGTTGPAPVLLFRSSVARLSSRLRQSAPVNHLIGMVSRSTSSKHLTLTAHTLGSVRGRRNGSIPHVGQK